MCAGAASSERGEQPGGVGVLRERGAVARRALRPRAVARRARAQARAPRRRRRVHTHAHTHVYLHTHKLRNCTFGVHERCDTSR